MDDLHQIISPEVRRAFNVAVLCADGPHHKYLIAKLAEKFDLSAVIIEPESAKLKRLKMSGRRKDYLYSLYHNIRRKLLSLDSYRRMYFLQSGVVESPSQCRILETQSINDDSVIELLKATEPDLTIIMGTSILRAKTLAVAGLAVNIHGGFLPYYRGNHCFFFALYEGKFDRIGTTIHFVDPGIDTGDIIEHVVPPMYSDDNAEKLYCRAEKMAIHRVVELVDEFRSGHPLPRHQQQGEGRTIRTRDRTPSHDITMWLRRRFRMLSIPSSPQDMNVTMR